MCSKNYNKKKQNYCNNHYIFSSFAEIDLYDPGNIQFVYFLQVFSLTKPFFPELRAKIISFMELKIWCIFEIAIMALLFNLFYGIKRNRKLAVLTFLVLLRVPLIYLTAPDNFFMYYYPFFLEGNIVMVGMAVKAIKTGHGHNLLTRKEKVIDKNK